MSVFSEQTARLLTGLNNSKTAIEGKGGTVSVSNVTPKIEEIVAGIETIETGGTPTVDYIFCTKACGDLTQGLIDDNTTLNRGITVTTITKT